MESERPPDGPWYRLAQLLLLLLFFLALAGGVALLLRQGTPRGIEVTPPTPSPTPGLRVYISGAVKAPGVYAAQPGERLEDIMARAGGATDDADLARVNLAQRVRDQEHLHIPALGETLPVATSVAAPSGTGEVVGGRLNINRASAEELTALPGIGEVKAKAIVSYRERYGSFKRIEDLLQVQGIGSATLERIRPLIAVE